MGTRTIWLMDSELCDWCNAPLGFFGECTNALCPSWDSFQPFDEDNDPFADTGDYDERAYFMGEYEEVFYDF